MMDIKATIKAVKGFSNEISEIAKELEKAKKIVIFGHKNPDMDCIGSQISLAIAMQEKGKEVTLYSHGPFSGYMANYENLYTNEIKNIDDFDLFVVVDTSSIDRIDTDFPLPQEKTVVLDHHFTNDNFGKINYVDSDLISATEIIFILLVFMDYPFNNPQISQILLDGILSDNGYYKHIRVDKFTSLLFTYLLISQGADPKETYDKMFVNNTAAEIKLLGKLFNRIETLKEDQIIYTYQTDDDETLANAQVSSALLFQQITSIKTGKIFIYFKINTAENKVVVSMRSNPGYDVGSIALSFGGGGHKVAAGVTLLGDYESVKKKILDEVLKIFQ